MTAGPPPAPAPGGAPPRAPILGGAPRRAGVIGWPAAHSLSPRVHGYWLKKHGIAGDYAPLPVRPENFETAVRDFAAKGFRGANVTAPHKEKAAALCARLDPAARAMGAVNTLVFEDGGAAGFNTDGYGFMQSLRAGAPGWTAARPAAVLGAGGAARAVCHALKDAGCAEIRIINRTRARAEALAAALNGAAAALSWEDRGAALDGAGLLVNTTTLGMTGKAPLEIDLTAAPEDAAVMDIVYAPLETPLLAAARKRGLNAVDGLGMLLHQAAPGFEAWFGVRPQVDEGLRAHVLAGRR